MNRKSKTSLILNILVLLIFGLILLIIISSVLFHYEPKEDLSFYLLNLNNLTGSISLILSTVTIYLLYKNYKHQEREFRLMNNYNRKSNNQLIRSNELSIINNQVEYLTNRLQAMVYKLDNGSMVSFETLVEYLNNEEVQNEYKKLVLKSHSDQISNILDLILSTKKTLEETITKVDFYPFLLNRLPVNIHGLESLLQVLCNEYEELRNLKIYRLKISAFSISKMYYDLGFDV